MIPNKTEKAGKGCYGGDVLFSGQNLHLRLHILKVVSHPSCRHRCRKQCAGHGRQADVSHVIMNVPARVIQGDLVRHYNGHFSKRKILIPSRLIEASESTAFEVLFVNDYSKH